MEFDFDLPISRRYAKIYGSTVMGLTAAAGGVIMSSNVVGNIDALVEAPAIGWAIIGATAALMFPLGFWLRHRIPAPDRANREE